jgi:osmotically-inducible protein OsmY
MLKSKLAIALISIPLFLVGCTSTHTDESTGQMVDSSAITMKVKAKLLADKHVKSLPITVNTYKDVVQLSGFVNNRGQAKRAVYIAEHVEGVKTVKDDLVVKSH